MFRFATILTLASATALSAHAAPVPEQWKQLTVMDGIAFSIDLDSVRTVNGQRHARLRTTFIDPNNKTIGFFDIAADCKARTIDTLHVDITNESRVLARQDHQPGEKRYMLDDEEGKLMAPYLCP
ncbi:hypothetical protein [Sphingomonas sp. G-3-2-10]|uniref:hypothetical protein n=1 Tax=Sphingomonas sp. G-3-2-10 TaxID=2728838 RepID=UPI00146CEF37|nr:hypothetical protein [Sphingomonas sp. G-3-2-10]NML04183.1 hypothetical protein [Sphingomonas sp. G-3-2-10]